MIILASAVIINLSNSGIINMAKDAVNSAEIASEKTAIEQAKAFAYKSSKGDSITAEQLQEAFDTTVEIGVVTVMDNVDTILIKFNESNRYYEIANTGKIEYLGNIKPKHLTVQSVDSTGKVLGENTYTVATNKYSIVPAQVEDYESAVEKIEGTIEEDTTIQQLYYKVLDDDTELVFTGLDENGSITTDETSIVSYMIGNGSGDSDNGLIEKKVQGILKVPEDYKQKHITKIGQSAFGNNENIIIADISNNIVTIEDSAFSLAQNMRRLIVGEKVERIGNYVFWNCYNLESVVLNSNIEEWGSLSFGGCPKWREIKTDNPANKYAVIDNVLYSYDGKIIKMCPKGIDGEYVIPENVEIIDNNSFANTIFKGISVSDKVRRINTNAFNSSHIESIIIGSGVEVIEDGSFSNCSSLKKITIESSMVAGNLTSDLSCGRLIYYAEIIYIKEGITPGSYIINTDNFTQSTTDKEGYVKYVKNISQ